MCNACVHLQAQARYNGLQSQLQTRMLRLVVFWICYILVRALNTAVAATAAYIGLCNRYVIA